MVKPKKEKEMKWPKRAPKTPRARRELWVAALRSGEFKQGKAALRTAEGYCCLGVGCEIYRRYHSSRVTWVGFSPQKWRFDAESSWLPLTVRDWFGLATSAGQIKYYDDLSAMNDRGASFTEIANVIEDGMVEVTE